MTAMQPLEPSSIDSYVIGRRLRRLRQLGLAIHGSLREGWLLILSSLLLGALLIVAVRLFYLLFTLDYRDPARGVTVMGAGIALIGVIFTGVVTLVGILLKQSIDRRGHELARVDATMRTVGLLTRDGHEPASIVQVSAALLGLAKLGEVHLAINLAAELWPAGNISGGAASLLADYGFRSGNPAIQHAAAMLLRNNVTRLNSLDETQYEWPDSLEQWNLLLPEMVRVPLAVALVKWIQEDEFEDKSSFQWRLVDAAFRYDPSPKVRAVISAGLPQLPGQ